MGTRGRFDVPVLDKEQLRNLLTAVADVIITLDDNYVVLGVTDPANVDTITVWKWTGRKLVDIVSPESVPKIARMLRYETHDAKASGRWRHVNFRDAAGKNVPLLVKYFQLSAGPLTTRLLVGRDLRPTQEAQQRFQDALSDMEQRGQARREPIDSALEASRDINDLIGRRPFNEIVVEATSILERAFFAEALKRTGGDKRAAAQLLGLSEEDFLARLDKSEGA